MNSTNPVSGTPGETVAEVRFSLTDGTVRTVTLYATGESRTLAIAVDGQPTGLSIRESYAETLIAAAKAVQAGEAFSTTW